MNKKEIEKWLALALIGAYQDKTSLLSGETLKQIKEKYNYEIKE